MPESRWPAEGWTFPESRPVTGPRLVHRVDDERLAGLLRAAAHRPDTGAAALRLRIYGATGIKVSVIPTTRAATRQGEP